jgi:hypothetical protein
LAFSAFNGVAWVSRSLPQPPRSLAVTPQRVGLFDEVLWLRIPSAPTLYHRLFWKEFSLEDAPQVRSARLYLSQPCRVKVNDTWVAQPASGLVDLTGYVRKGDNTLLLDFPQRAEDSAFAARVRVEYMNSDRVTFFSDSSWLVSVQYNLPSPLAKGNQGGFGAPTVIAGPLGPKGAVLAAERPPVYATDFAEWRIDMPCTLGPARLAIPYGGDRAQLRDGYRLVADNFNNNTPWYVRVPPAWECRQLRLEVRPLAPDQPVLFDQPPTVSAVDPRLEPVYESTGAR